MDRAYKRIKNSYPTQIDQKIHYPVEKSDAILTGFDSLKLEDLNDYALFEIFNHIPINDILTIKQTSKRFYFLVENYLSKIDQVMVYVDDDHKFEGCREHQQTELSCIHSVNDTKKFLNNFLIRLTRLKVLNLCFLTIDERNLIRLTNLSCIGTTLKHLEISHCEFKNFYLTAQTTYENFFEKLGDKLEHLAFYKNSFYLVPVNYLLQSINKYLINLTTLVLDFKQYEDFKSPNAHLKNNTKLKSLNFHGFFSRNNLILDKFIAKKINSELIECLNLRCVKMDRNHLIHTILSCCNLKILKFSYDYNDDNQYGRKLITSNSVFEQPWFAQHLQILMQGGNEVKQYRLACTIAKLRHLEELHLTEIESGNVNIDPLVLYLYHNFKRNNVRRLIITNYELHLMNLKAFCYVTKKLEVLCINELRSCCYKMHNYQANVKLSRTVNESFIKTFKWLTNLTTLSLNQCNFGYEILESLLNVCHLKVANFSFLRCERLNYANCIDLFILYANSNPDLKVTVKLDENLVQQIENQSGPLLSIPKNLKLIPV